jgi:hypothetical protein
VSVSHEPLLCPIVVSLNRQVEVSFASHRGILFVSVSELIPLLAGITLFRNKRGSCDTTMALLNSSIVTFQILHSK